MQSILRLVLLVVIAPIILIQGCDSTSNEPLPNSGISLCINLYETCVEPIMHNATANQPAVSDSCSDSGCHAPPSGQDGFFLYNDMPTTGANLVSNFNQVEARTLNNNLLLSKATGNAHGGGKRFNVGDLCYNTIADWNAIAAPTDGSACTSVIPNCPLAPALILTCGQ